MSYPFCAELVVERYLHGVRIDSFLVKHFRNYTPYTMQRMVRAKQIKIDGVTAEPEDRVCGGDLVSVRLTEPPDKLIEAQELPLEILYEDPWIVVVNKPVGQVAHPCGNHVDQSLANALQFHFDQQTRLPGLARPGIVHRLDKLTSGVMVVTKDHMANRRVGTHFETGRVCKTYFALVHGNLDRDTGMIDMPIGVVPGGESFLMTTAADALEPRWAKTSFRVQERFDDYTLVKAQPLTGRMHQIRVHLASIGHPIVADEFYGYDGPVPLGPRQTAPRAPAIASTSLLMERQALHAYELSIIHPITRKPMTFQAPLAPDLETALARLRRQTRTPAFS